MWKTELKEQLDLYVNINLELTAKICYLLLWKNKYVKARMLDWIEEEQISREIKKMDYDLEITKDKLYEHYKFN